MMKFLHSDRIRVVVNALHAKSGGGVTYLRNLLPLLAEDPELELHLFVHESQFAVFADLHERIRLHILPFRPGFLLLLLWEQLALPLLIRDVTADVVLSPANYGPLLQCNQVIVLQNSLAVGDSERRWIKRQYWRALGVMTALSLLQARAAIAVSAYVVRSAVRLPQLLRRPIHVVHHGVSAAFHPGTDPREDYLLAVGDLYVQKNFGALVRAMELIRRQRPDIRLRIAGRPIDRHHAEELKAQVQALGLQDNVEFLGEQSPAQVAELYRRCALFVFPSVEESFGMPVLEAMASGCAIVCSDAAAMPEVASDSVRYFPPHDSEALAQNVLELLDQPGLREELGQRAVARAATFSWANAARLTGDILKQVARGVRSPDPS